MLDQAIRLHDASLHIELELRNTDDHAWTFSAALHSYWRVAPDRPVRLDSLADTHFEDRSEAGCDSPAPGPLALADEIERLYLNAPQTVFLQDKRTLRLASDGWPDLMVWNAGPAEGQALDDLENGGQERFICVEPLQFGVTWLAPGST